MQPQKTVGIGEVVQLCGVSEKQLRYWQDAGHITPETVACGDRTYRRYREQDIALVKAIKEYLDEGFTLTKAAKKAKEQNYA